VIFRITAQKLQRSKQVPILTPIGRERHLFAVGDTFKGWLSERRRRQVCVELRRLLRWSRDVGFNEHVLADGKWEIVSYFNDY
jgi:hypothetical protein